MNNNGNEKFNGQQQEAEKPASEQQARDEKCATEQQGTLPVSKRSTGPRTPLGKNRSARNASKHALFSRSILVRGESQSDLDKLLRGLRCDFKPVGAFEALLVDKIASDYWRLQRFLRAERAAVEGLAVVVCGSVLPADGQMDLVLRCEAHLYRVLERDLNELERAQERRKRKKAIAIPDDSTPDTDDPQD